MGRSHKFFAFFLAAGLLLGCQQKKDEVAASGSSSVASSDLTGSWYPLDTCEVSGNNALYRDFVLKGSSLEERQFHYVTVPECTGTNYMRLDIKYCWTVSGGDDVDGVTGAKTLTLTLQKAVANPQFEVMAAYLEQNNVCGISDWGSGVLNTVTGLTCDWGAGTYVFPTAGATFSNIYKIVNNPLRFHLGGVHVADGSPLPTSLNMDMNWELLPDIAPYAPDCGF